MADVVVIGAGITGLSAAWELSRLDDPPRITVLEASDRVGGKILGTPFAGLSNVEAGPDMFLARVPWAMELCATLGLTDLVSPASGKAYVWWDGRLHPIPAGLVLGAPTDLVQLARSGLLSWRGKARAALDPVLPRRPFDDDLGRLVRGRFGAEVLERLVDPLVGGINAGDADRLSLMSAAPQIAQAASRSRSLLIGLRDNRPDPAAGPAFLTPAGGLDRLVEALVAAMPLVEIRRCAPVTSIERAGHRFTLGGFDGGEVDAVVVATPAFAAAGLLAGVAPGAASLAATIPAASVAVVTLAFPTDAVAVELDGSGHLVPKPVQGSMTACSWASTKWAHYRRDGQVILRASLGRFGNERALGLDDDELLALALAELRPQLGIRGEPTEVRITRWPRSFPQHLPGHLDRVTALERGLPPGLGVAGASYRGIGIPACIRQGRDAARAVADHLGLMGHP